MRTPPPIGLVLAVSAACWLCAGCAGRALTKKTAHGAILRASTDTLGKDDVDIVSASQTGSDQAVVEANVRVGFAMEKVRDEWTIREVKIGHGEWQKLQDLLAALAQEKIRSTRVHLEEIAAALERYYKEHRSLPQFADYTSLTDALHPGHMTPLIRLDAWRNPFTAVRTGPNSVRLASSGPDGRI
ncbi:MAG: hypothetical protein ABIG68_07150, partial [Acidobacteriota bacterium]